MTPRRKIAVLFLLGVLSLGCMALFRDTLSLIFWKARYIGTRRAVGSGPKVIFQATEPGGIGVNLFGISEKEWKVSLSWAPTAQSFTLLSEKTIITLGCWWDGFGGVTTAPTDSNGTFLNAMARTVGLSNAPVQNQITYQSTGAVGRHVITPPKIGQRGDGYFLVLEVDGLAASSPIRDTGQSRKSHPYFGHGDPETIESISVSTEGKEAQVGDLAVALFSMDPCDNPNIHINLPEGWTSLGFNDAALLNIGYRACCKIVSVPGRQSAACTWSDDSTFVAEATMVIFKAAQQGIR